ncbi:MAG TPA: glycosyltransferase family 39 protein [Solirubrobacteraceae bacterium]|jgi:4-amino-4-deoxy-L-arabinose transferase-like glycosyltransferase
MQMVRARIDAGRSELALLTGAVVLGLAVRVAYVLATRHFPLAGDAPEYDSEGYLIAHGHPFWTFLPYGILHAGAWKAPGYPAWVGFWYWLIGHHVLAVRLLQVPLDVFTIVLSWLLARRLFGARVAIAAAFVVALYPLAWQFNGLLYPEALATPLTVALLLVMFTGELTARRAALFGVLLGVTLLIRPTTEFMLLGALVAWSVALGFKRGVGLTVVAGVVAVLVVAPWTVRNAIVMHGFVPISMQDSALYGTFNATSANDPLFPYAWRREPPNVAHLFDPHHPLSDVTLRSKLITSGVDYIKAHPASVPEAFFWNGLSRLWDIRRRSRALAEVPFEGRSRLVNNLGLDAYLVLLPLALIGLWRTRRRRALVLGILGLALGASIVFTVDAGTRYRAPLEPLIAIMACVAVLGTREGLTASRSGRI